MRQTSAQALSLSPSVLTTTQYHTRYFDFLQLMKNFCHSYEEALAAKNLLLCTRFALDLPKVLLGDPQLLMQLLQDLSAYTLRQEARGCVVIELKAEPDGPQHYCIELLLTLSGGGIARGKAKVLFLPVGEGNRGAADQGHGASLYFARKISQLYDGDISVCNSPGFGSRFLVKLHMSCAGACFYRMTKSQKV